MAVPASGMQWPRTQVTNDSVHPPIVYQQLPPQQDCAQCVSIYSFPGYIEPRIYS